MSLKHVIPSTSETAFSCPHCGVLAIQHWGNLYEKKLEKGTIPTRYSDEHIERMRELAAEKNTAFDPVEKYFRRHQSGDVFIDNHRYDIYCFHVANLDVATCDHCGKITVWLSDVMVFPIAGDIVAHDDLPDNVKLTFAEASKIAEVSPRASAALARLAIQELCIALECRSDKLDGQIGELVERGLSPDIKKMLDGVRVIGNNAVHPGEIDLRDKQDTAKFLLNCINRICQRMITEPKEADALFEMLPDGAKAAIERRDEKINAKREGRFVAG